MPLGIQRTDSTLTSSYKDGDINLQKTEKMRTTCEDDGDDDNGILHNSLL